MARTKQTARQSTGGVAPRAKLGSRAAPAPGLAEGKGTGTPSQNNQKRPSSPAATDIDFKRAKTTSTPGPQDADPADNPALAVHTENSRGPTKKNTRAPTKKSTRGHTKTTSRARAKTAAVPPPKATAIDTPQTAAVA